MPTGNTSCGLPQRRARRYLPKLSLVDQTARHQTVRSSARKPPNFSALETPTPFRAGIFLGYTGSQIRHRDRRTTSRNQTTSRNHKNRLNACDIEMIMRHRLPPIKPMFNARRRFALRQSLMPMQNFRKWSTLTSHTGIRSA